MASEAGHLVRVELSSSLYLSLPQLGESRVLEQAKISEPFAYLLKPFGGASSGHQHLEMALYKSRMERERERLRPRAPGRRSTIMTLTGPLPICALVQESVRDDSGYWMRVEQFVEQHSEGHLLPQRRPAGVRNRYFAPRKATMRQWPSTTSRPAGETAVFVPPPTL